MAVSTRSTAASSGTLTDVQRKGAGFGRWLRGALERSGLSVSQLSQEADLPQGLVRAYLNDCLTPDGRHRMPGADAVRRMAEVMDLPAAEALRILGHSVPADLEAPSGLSVLPSSTQAALARAVNSILSGHIVELPVVQRVPHEAQAVTLEGIEARYPVLKAMVAEEASPSELFAVRVDGYDVPEMFLRDGDWLICRRGRDARPGDTAIVNRDGIATATPFDGNLRGVLGVVLARTGSLR